jgi:hypothetical protein
MEKTHGVVTLNSHDRCVTCHTHSPFLWHRGCEGRAPPGPGHVPGVVQFPAAQRRYGDVKSHRVMVSENRYKFLKERHKDTLALDQSALLDLLAQASIEIYVYAPILDPRPQESRSPEDLSIRPKRLDRSIHNELQLLQLG